ncbi:NADH dehydrogenase (quinone) [Desulfotomaculum nigrificans CO-1-SRB]|uniref:NADH dehydrogenase (Quinone) n=1 Tax=Desulfotomaculum nigrificans (strain DSM 14880 / VKM B-2319 / CO-1-SRB) TaxID=868595 RepID=F6B430_DESCC|nr:NADH-quinone oxidoreductase subunit NuoF [Desulfotomaculum nigrificans]AEF94085.1 NADH dehydrogenase (quinone) [Desulfotomaculum nigrificans CO-1-SRB]
MNFAELELLRATARESIKLRLGEEPSDNFKYHVLVCGGTGCISIGCQNTLQAMQKAIEDHGLQETVKLVVTGCMGTCEMGPVITVFPEGYYYCRVKPEDVEEIVTSHLKEGKFVERLCYHAADGTVQPKKSDMVFFKKQKRNALRNCGLINQTSIEEYIAMDGYKALAKVLQEMTPQQVVDEVKKSGLRGRGGAGFPTGMKWQFVLDQKADQKYVVVNGDEGDPGAFMDRSVLEDDPYSVIEAMTIGGYAVGASKGYAYIRLEYPRAIDHFTKALARAREVGLLGNNILGTDFSFDIEIRVGAGAFVCGEETALLASIEGRRGEPRPRPPFPAVSGLFGKPTLINNVETWANICPIIIKGGDWYATMGTEKSKGTKVFTLAGKINNTGLVEVPLGITLREIVEDIGGGVPGGKAFKAAQTGGPSGGCIPAAYLDTPIDYENLAALGSIVGSGGMIIVDEGTCMVDLAKFYLGFTQDESCGKCTPCRIGTKRMLEILERITKGVGKEEDIELLIELANSIKASALCGLGQTAPNPILSTLRYFRDEYEAHVKDKTCPAGVCKMPRKGLKS